MTKLPEAARGLIGGRYRIDGTLGEGGVGIVYAGVHTWTGRAVAVKVLRPEYAADSEIVERFLSEARAAAALRHRHVIDVLDMGSQDGVVYMVMERLEGETIAARLARTGPFHPHDAVAILKPVMEALDVAHRAGIVHRDLKPENIFLAHDDAGHEVAKLLDFGIAKIATGQDVRSAKTRVGTLIGTPQYMSPEQASGDGSAGASSDIWSMAVIMYELVTGKLPFDGDSLMAILMAIGKGQYVPAHEIAPVPPRFSAVIARALQAQPEARPRTMLEFAAELELSLADTPKVISSASGPIARGVQDSGVWTPNQRRGMLGLNTPTPSPRPLPLEPVPNQSLTNAGLAPVPIGRPTPASGPHSYPSEPRTSSPVPSAPSPSYPSNAEAVEPVARRDPNKLVLLAVSLVGLLLGIGLFGWWLVSRDTDPVAHPIQEESSPVRAPVTPVPRAVPTPLPATGASLPAAGASPAAQTATTASASSPGADSPAAPVPEVTRNLPSGVSPATTREPTREDRPQRAEKRRASRPASRADLRSTAPLSSPAASRPQPIPAAAPTTTPTPRNNPPPRSSTLPGVQVEW